MRTFYDAMRRIHNFLRVRVARCRRRIYAKLYIYRYIVNDYRTEFIDYNFFFFSSSGNGINYPDVFHMTESRTERYRFCTLCACVYTHRIMRRYVVSSLNRKWIVCYILLWHRLDAETETRAYSLITWWNVPKKKQEKNR